jgi:hypothetical protein
MGRFLRKRPGPFLGAVIFLLVAGAGLYRRLPELGPPAMPPTIREEPVSGIRLNTAQPYAGVVTAENTPRADENWFMDAPRAVTAGYVPDSALDPRSRSENCRFTQLPPDTVFQAVVIGKGGLETDWERRPDGAPLQDADGAFIPSRHGVDILFGRSNRPVLLALISLEAKADYFMGAEPGAWIAGVIYVNRAPDNMMYPDTPGLRIPSVNDSAPLQIYCDGTTRRDIRPFEGFTLDENSLPQFLERLAPVSVSTILRREDGIAFRVDDGGIDEISPLRQHARLPHGQDAINALIAEGFIRPAEAKDIENWRLGNARARGIPADDLPDYDLRPDNSYVLISTRNLPYLPPDWPGGGHVNFIYRSYGGPSNPPGQSGFSFRFSGPHRLFLDDGYGCYEQDQASLTTIPCPEGGG